jgi:hypothetical protein
MDATSTTELAAALERRSKLKAEERDRRLGQRADGANVVPDEDPERLPLPLIPF